MRLTGSRAYYRPSPPKMPPGLIELMEGLSKEVLKHNPTDVYGFCAGHMQELLEKRDGPTVKKTISLEEKITRAQEKVRKRAEKRRQEYDKNMILLQQSRNVNESDAKDGTSTTLHVPQLAPDEETYSTPGEDNTTLSPPNPMIQHNITTPLHQELALESSSEVEISQESGVDVNTPRDNFSADDTDHDVCNDDIRINESSKHNINTEVLTTELPKTVIKIAAAGPNNESKIEVEMAATKIPNIETSNELESEKISNNASDISSETAAIIETSNRKESNKSPDNTSVIPSEPSRLEIETTNEPDSKNTSDISPDPVILKSNDNVKDDTEINTETFQPVVTIPLPEILRTDFGENVTKTKENENKDIVKVLNKDVLIKSHEDTDNTNCHTDHQQDKTENSEHAYNSEDIQNPEKTDLTTSDSKQTQNDTGASNTQDTVNNPDSNHNPDDTDLEQNINASAIHESSPIAKDNSEINNKNDLSLDNSPIRALPAVTDPVNNSDYITVENTVDVHLSSTKELYKEEKTDQAKPAISVSEELPATGGDSDIATLMTDESVDDTNVNELNNSLEPLDSMSQVDKDNLVKAILESETLNDEIHQNTQKDDESENIQNQNDKNGGSNMDLETAAVTIQKVFRNFLFKSRSSTEDTGNDESNFLDEGDKNKEECDFPIASALNIDRRPHGITRMDTVLQTVNEEKSLSLSDDSSTLSSAATIIQAHVRGFLIRNRLNSNKTVSTNSLAASNSNEPSITSLEADNEHNRNKTVLNIHIVPEGGENYLSRDESLITSMELSLDSSPPSSINLHPLGYDKSERRKQLKREDAIQSISPPSNNSGKLSEDFDSVKELSLNDHDAPDELLDNNVTYDDVNQKHNDENGSIEYILKLSGKVQDSITSKTDDTDAYLKQKRKSLTKMSSDELDVVSPYKSNEDSASSKLLHSGEFHDAVLPTRVSRSDTSVVSVQLKAELKKRKASLTGKTADLVARRESYDKNFGIDDEGSVEYLDCDESMVLPSDTSYKDINASTILPPLTGHHLQLFAEI